uniref:Uncharacterized protein n=1 Tax=Bionectria ochroleuca TaxID=29856 RepID=A0A8H7N535_BIOOC
MAGSHYTPELLAKFAKRTRDNHNTMYLFGIIMGGILFICMLFHLIRILGRKCLSRKQSKPSVFQLATRQAHQQNIKLRLEYRADIVVQENQECGSTQSPRILRPVDRSYRRHLPLFRRQHHSHPHQPG